MKKAKIRFLSWLLMGLMVFGGAVPVALSEDAFSEDAHRALAASLYGDALPGISSGVMIGGLKHILDGGGGFVEGKGFDTLWGWIFGTDNTNQLIIESLNRIEGKLDDILRELANLKNLLKQKALEERLTTKLQEMDAANTVLKQAVAEFERAPTVEAKMKALDIWFAYNPKGYSNAFYFFSNYCDRVAGTTTYEGVSLFSIYDEIADLKWNFDHEGAAFRQMQREADIHFITRMSAMLTLWLDRETQDGGGYLSKYTPEELDGFRQMLNKGLENVIHAYEYIPVNVRDDRIGFHMYSGDERIAFDIYKGDTMPGSGATTVNLHETLVASLRDGKTVQQAEEAMQAFLKENGPPITMAGEQYTLASRGAISVLQLAAKDRKGITVKELLEGAGFPGGDWRFTLYTSAAKENTPIRFSKAYIVPIIGTARNVYINNVDLAEKNIDARNYLGAASVRGTTAPGVDQLTRSRVPALFYEAVHADYTLAKRIQDTPYLALWITNAQNVPVIEDIDPEGDAVETQAIVHVESVADGVLAGRLAEAVPVSLFIDDQTALPEGITQAMLPGNTVKIDYEPAPMADGTWQEGMPFVRATRIELTQPVDGMCLDGTVVRIESAAQIIGGTEDLVVESEGQQYIFDLTAQTAMDEGVAPGVTVQVMYHEVAEGMRQADTVTVTGISPVPAPEVAEGSIVRLNLDAMPGSQGTLTIGIPGGEMTIYIPTGIAVDALQEGMLVRVTYHTLGDAHTADHIEVIGDPAPDDTGRVVDGVVAAYDVSMEIIGQPAQVTLSIPGGEIALSAPYGLPYEADVGASVHVHYRVRDGINIADDISVIAPPDPYGPVDPVDPIDPVPSPVQAWVEGYVMQRQDDPAVLAPGQARTLVVSAAGQDFTLQIPEQMMLADDVQVGAFVHIDYMAYQDGQNIIGTLIVMQPVPQPEPPVDDPMPGPLDPMPGPLGG